VYASYDHILQLNMGNVISHTGYLQNPGHKMTKIEDGPADKFFFGGNIYTMDAKQQKVQALAVKGERILTVGLYDDVVARTDDQTECIDLKGRTLLPGFIEAHEHAVLKAKCRYEYIDIAAISLNGEKRTKEDVIKIMKDHISKEMADCTNLKDTVAWCVFFGYDVELLDLPQLGSEELISLVCGTMPISIPVVIITQNGHAAWANPIALQACNITKAGQCPSGGRYGTTDDGEQLNGMLYEEPAIISILSHSSKGDPLDAVSAFRFQWNDYAARGFTTVTEMAYSPDVTMDLFLSTLATLKDCPIRLALYISEGSKIEPCISPCGNNHKLWIAGKKVWADGSPHCGTAAVAKEYCQNNLTSKLAFPPPPPPPKIPDEIRCGVLNFTYDELSDRVKKIHNEGKQVAIHSHGERAIDQCLEVFQHLKMKPGDNRRHRLEHLGFATEKQLELCGKLGVTTSLFVQQLYYYGKTFSESIIGPERTNRWAPLADVVKHVGENKFSLHEDHPTFPGPSLPFASIRTAVTRTQQHYPDTIYGEKQRITVDQAIKAYTIGPAYQLFKEDEIGSLEVGKLADLLIVSADPYEIPPMNLDTDVKVVATYIGGQCTNNDNMRSMIT